MKVTYRMSKREKGRLSGKKSILEAVQSRSARCIRMRAALWSVPTATHTHQLRWHSLRVLREEKYRYPPTQCLCLRISEGVSGWHWSVTLPYLKFYLVNGGLKRKSGNFSSSIKQFRFFLIYFLIMWIVQVSYFRKEVFKFLNLGNIF